LTTTPTATGRPRVFARLMKYEFGRFLVVGGTAAAANLASAWCYRRLFENTPCYFEVSVSLGFSLGTVISFVLNKFVTFRAHEGNTWVQLFRFLLISIVSIALSTLVAHLILQGLLVLFTVGDTRLVESVAHVLTVGIMTVFNFAAMKYIAFAKARLA
jgi:putative flippase GtrA